MNITKLDRRVIFGIMLVIVVVTTLIPLKIPVKVSAPTRLVYDTIQSIAPGSLVVIEVGFDAALWSERGYQLMALSQHLVDKKLKAIFVGIYRIDGPMLIERALSSINLKDWKYGVDYVNLGYIPGVETALAALFREPEKVTVTDYYGTPREQLPLLNGYKGAADVSLFIVISSVVPDMYIRQWYVPFKKPLVYGASAMMAPGVMPYVTSGQVKAMLIGSTGAAEYEMLIGSYGGAARMGDSLSSLHLFMLVLIGIASIGGKLTARSQKKTGESK